MISYSTHAAFGYILTCGRFEAHDVINIDPLLQNVFTVGSKFEYIWLYTEGGDVLVNTATGDTIEMVAGDCTLSKPIPSGEWRSMLPGSVTVFCASPFLNVGRLPLEDHLSEFKLLSGEQRQMPQGAQLFLAKGSLEVDGQILTGPMQVRFKSGAKTVSATESAFGFIVS